MSSDRPPEPWRSFLADIDAAAETINGLESVRSQLQALRRLVQDPGVIETSKAI